MKKTIAALAATAGLSLAVSAHATEAQGHPPSTAVHVEQTNLRDPAAVKSLYAKLVRAAQEVCTSGAIDHFVAQGSDQACVQSTLNSVVGKVNRPLLTALHEERNPKTGFAARD